MASAQETAPGSLTGVRGATVPEDPNYVGIHGLSKLQAALVTAAPGQHAILIDTARRFVAAVRNVLARDPTLPLYQIDFTELGDIALRTASWPSTTLTPASGVPPLCVIALPPLLGAQHSASLNRSVSKPVVCPPVDS